MSRRDFLARASLLAATAAFVAACGDGQIGGVPITDPGGQTTIDVSTFPGLATVDRLVLVDGRHAVKRTGAAAFAAFSRTCPHQGTAVLLNGSGFRCPNHGSQFDNSGQVTLGPASRNLSQLVTTYDAATDELTIG